MKIKTKEDWKIVKSGDYTGWSKFDWFLFKYADAFVIFLIFALYIAAMWWLMRDGIMEMMRYLL